jgi:hypothetical protein
MIREARGWASWNLRGKRPTQPPRYAYVLVVGFVIERRARSRKARSGLRALLGRAPDAAEVRIRLARLLPRMWKGVVEATAKRITAKLHRFAPAVRFKLEPDADLIVRSDDGGVGPAYHDEVFARLDPILDELDYVWDGPAPDPRAGALAWLADELRGGATQLAMPEGRRFVIDGVQTALGPRDAAWRAAVLADPAAGRDAFAWWERGPGELARSRALLAMWHDVPWREPFDKAEHALMERVDADLEVAHDAGLDVPWAEWAELARYLGDHPRGDRLAEQATGPAAIGYRRHDTIVEVGGWSVTLPGAFAGKWEDDGQRYWASDGARVVELALLETTAGDSATLIEVAPSLHPVIERAAEGERHARAEAYQEDDVHIVHGLVATAPYVAILTCKGRATDEAWALATWRSLHRT